MKEFLEKQANGYVLVKDACKRSEDWIEVPEGAECLTLWEVDNKSVCYLFWRGNHRFCVGFFDRWAESGFKSIKEYINASNGAARIVWQRPQQPESLPFVDDEVQSINDQYAEIEQVRQAKNYETEKNRENSHYFIDVSDVNEVDFYEIAKRYNVTDPAIQHILKKCLAIGNRGHKDLETDLKDILKTAKRALQINGFGEQQWIK